MFKKFIALAVTCAVLMMMTVPALAMLKVLDPALSEELRGIARNHLVETLNIQPGAVSITDSWVREFWNVKVDVYMVVAIIDRGLPTEKKVQLPVRVDQKVVLTDAELKALEEQDNSLATSDPQIRILAVEQVTKPNYTPYYVLGIVLVGLLGTAAFIRMRRKA
ncbi:MAG: hypothetical protein DDT42_01679 [candidate division WS2 bacterium]|uniref:Uncharacterized protein n=1 Tax=Psychracetigena formicireducens TaxID=2986056 RepID=A0A9E2BHU6_PSYF1|nr:hypothetical protein [Candidatus Psychracetigena formicireducens]MBT9145802.1 hypothetical protein [Candidatus Psychracetigena formicireducens]